MKKIFNKVLIAFAAGSISLSSCTDLEETLYSDLNESNIDLSNETDLSLLLGAATAQYRYLVEDWFGMYHLLEESTDQYMVPARVGVGWAMPTSTCTSTTGVPLWIRSTTPGRLPIAASAMPTR